MRATIRQDQTNSATSGDALFPRRPVAYAHVQASCIAIMMLALLGGSFLSAQALDSPDTVLDTTAPFFAGVDAVATSARLAASGDVLACAWIEETLEDQRLMTAWTHESEFAPGAFSEPVRLNSSDMRASEISLAVGGDGLIHVAWVAEISDGSSYLNYTLLTPEGDWETLALNEALAENAILERGAPSLPRIAVDSATNRALIAWQHGAGSFQTIKAAVQLADGAFEITSLTPADRPDNHFYPQIFASANGSTLATWYTFAEDGLHLEGATREGSTGAEVAVWTPIDPESPTGAWLNAVPVERLPLLVQRPIAEANPETGPGMGAIYIDAGVDEATATTSDSVLYLDESSPGSPLALIALGGSDAAVKLEAAAPTPAGTLLTWLRDRLEATSVEAAWLGLGDPTLLATANDDGAPASAEGVLVDPVAGGLSGASAVTHAGAAHVVWWTDVIDGGDGVLHYRKRRVDLAE